MFSWLPEFDLGSDVWPLIPDKRFRWSRIGVMLSVGLRGRVAWERRHRAEAQRVNPQDGRRAPAHPKPGDSAPAHKAAPFPQLCRLLTVQARPACPGVVGLCAPVRPGGPWLWAQTRAGARVRHSAPVSSGRHLSSHLVPAVLMEPGRPPSTRATPVPVVCVVLGLRSCGAEEICVVLVTTTRAQRDA